MGLKPQRLAVLVVFLGASLAVVGVAMVAVPAAVILAGLAIAAVGLLVDLEALRR